MHSGQQLVTVQLPVLPESCGVEIYWRSFRHFGNYNYSLRKTVGKKNHKNGPKIDKNCAKSRCFCTFSVFVLLQNNCAGSRGGRRQCMRGLAVIVFDLCSILLEIFYRDLCNVLFHIQLQPKRIGFRRRQYERLLLFFSTDNDVFRCLRRVQLDDLMVALEAERSKSAALDKKQRKFDQNLAEEKAVSDR